VTYQRTLKSIPFYESVNLSQYITNNKPQATTGNQTTSDQISEFGILGSQVEFKRLGKTYTTNLIDKHRMAYPTYKLHITLQLCTAKEKVLHYTQVGRYHLSPINSEIQFPLSYMWINMMPLSGTSSIPSHTPMLIPLQFSSCNWQNKCVRWNVPVFWEVLVHSVKQPPNISLHHRRIQSQQSHLDKPSTQANIYRKEGCIEILPPAITYNTWQ
jgi:hypothetical protein